MTRRRAPSRGLSKAAARAARSASRNGRRWPAQRPLMELWAESNPSGRGQGALYPLPSATRRGVRRLFATLARALRARAWPGRWPGRSLGDAAQPPAARPPPKQRPPLRGRLGDFRVRENLGQGSPPAPETRPNAGFAQGPLCLQAGFADQGPLRWPSSPVRAAARLALRLPVAPLIAPAFRRRWGTQTLIALERISG